MYSGVGVQCGDTVSSPTLSTTSVPIQTTDSAAAVTTSSRKALQTLPPTNVPFTSVQPAFLTVSQMTKENKSNIANVQGYYYTNIYIKYKIMSRLLKIINTYICNM